MGSKNSNLEIFKEMGERLLSDPDSEFNSSAYDPYVGEELDVEKWGKLLSLPSERKFAIKTISLQYFQSSAPIHQDIGYCDWTKTDIAFVALLFSHLNENYPKYSAFEEFQPQFLFTPKKYGEAISSNTSIWRRRRGMSLIREKIMGWFLGFRAPCC